MRNLARRGVLPVARRVGRARYMRFDEDVVAAFGEGRPAVPPSYHDLYVTTADIPRTRLFDLPYGLEVTVPAAVTCNRVAGWELWQTHSDPRKWKLLAGEYDGPGKWLLLDVDGHVIVDSRQRYLPDGDDPGRPTLSHRHPLEGPGWARHEHPGGPHWHDPVSLSQVPIREGDNG